MEKAARRIAGICAAIAVVAAVSCAFAPEERSAEQAGAARSPFGDATADSPAKGGGKPFPYRGTSTPDSRGQGDFSVSAVNRAIGERMRDNPHVTTDARGALSLDSRVLFGYDSAELSEEGRESLTEFLRDYMRAVFDENGNTDVSWIVIEGHTDTDGSYDYNLDLSENRAYAVMEFCIEQYPMLADYLVAVGCSYDDPVYREDGTVDMEASRRVCFLAR